MSTIIMVTVFKGFNAIKAINYIIMFRFTGFNPSVNIAIITFKCFILSYSYVFQSSGYKLKKNQKNKSKQWNIKHERDF